MKSGKTVFPPRFYINICEEENPWIHRNPIRYEKSVTPATLVDNQCFVVKLPGFSFHTSCICSFLLILWLNLCKRLHFDKTERNNTLKSDKTKRNECSHINIFIEENIERRGHKLVQACIYKLICVTDWTIRVRNHLIHDMNRIIRDLDLRMHLVLCNFTCRSKTVFT